MLFAATRRCFRLATATTAAAANVSANYDWPATANDSAASDGPVAPNVSAAGHGVSAAGHGASATNGPAKYWAATNVSAKHVWRSNDSSGNGSVSAANELPTATTTASNQLT